MADPLNFTPAALSRTVRHAGGAFTPESVQAEAGPEPCGQPQSYTVAVTVEGEPSVAGDITLAKVGGASWLTVPATCGDGTPFDVMIDGSELAAGDYSETIRASAAGYDDEDCVVTLSVDPMGPDA